MQAALRPDVHVRAPTPTTSHPQTCRLALLMRPSSRPRPAPLPAGEGHVAAVKKVLEDKSLRCVPYNLGTGTGGGGHAGRAGGGCGLGLRCSGWLWRLRWRAGRAARGCKAGRTSMPRMGPTPACLPPWSSGPVNRCSKRSLHPASAAPLPGTTVLEMVHAFEKASGLKVNLNLTGRRPGDAKAVWAATETAEKELG